MELAAERLHRTTVDIVAELAKDPGLAGEVLRAQRQFFAGTPDYVPDGEAHAAAHGRFAEWFVLERDSEHLGAVPIDAVGGVPGPVRDALRASVCGLFLVESTSPDVRVRDVSTDEVFELRTDAALAPGDLVVGRAYPGELDTLVPSPAAAILRQGTAVAAALQRDLARAAIARRLTQAELEAVLFRSVGELSSAQARRVPPERLEARLDSLLREGGDESHSAAAISEALEAAVDGPGNVMGPLLETLAFDTEVDLDAMRATMLELWNEHRLRQQEREPAPQSVEELSREEPQPRAAVPEAGPGLGAAIADRIERGLAEHEDIEALFADVQSMLGDDEDDEEEVGEGGGVSQGDLDALVQEYLWERQIEADSPQGNTLVEFVAHQTDLPVPGVYLEAIPAREILSFLLRAYLAAPPAARAGRVQAMFDALSAFYSWAEETQTYELAATLAECRRLFVDALDRLQQAGTALSQGGVPSGEQPRVLRIRQVDGGEIEVVGAGTGPVWADVPEAAPHLRPDDLVLAAFHADGRGGLRIVGPALVLPGAVADLLE